VITTQPPTAGDPSNTGPNATGTPVTHQPSSIIRLHSRAIAADVRAIQVYLKTRNLLLRYGKHPNLFSDSVDSAHAADVVTAAGRAELIASGV
jgi:hypothetical protein